MIDVGVSLQWLKTYEKRAVKLSIHTEQSIEYKDAKTQLNDTATIDYKFAEADLSHFFLCAWDVLEPQAKLYWNWHHDLVCEYLMACYTGQIRRLIINIPPRTTKSLLCTVTFPVWVWLQDPRKRFLFGSYADSLARKHSLLRRNLIQSPWFQKYWAKNFQLSDDQNLKSNFTNNKTGQMISAGLLGSITGEGGDYVVIDDPHNPKKANSDTERESSLIAFDQAWSTRLNDKKNGRIIVIMQRLHENDLTGHLLSKNAGYVHLKIPQIAEQKTIYTFPLSGKELTRKAGELLHKERDGHTEIEQIKKDLGSYGFCTPKESPILMWNLSLKPISDIIIGDKIIGIDVNTAPKSFNKSCSRRKLIQTEVIAISKSIQMVYKIKLDSGKTIRCTLNHKWYTGRGGQENNKYNRPLYRPAKIGRSLMRVCDDKMPILNNDDLYDAGWLSGFFDGEGSAVLRKNGTDCLLTFTQGIGRNLPLCEKLEQILKKFNFNYGIVENIRDDRKYNRDSCHKSRTYYIKKSDAMHTYQRFLHLIKPNKWRDRIISGALGAKFISNKEKVISIEKDRLEEVYGLKTMTGNYIVWGLASSNSGQQQQDPSPSGGGLVKRAWWRYYKALPSRFDQTIISMDPTFKGDENNDYVVAQCWGRVGANKYLIDQVRARLDFVTTIKTFRAFCAKHPNAHAKLVEAKANGEAIINTLKNEIPGIIPINPKTSKIQRVEAVAPQIESGNVYLPDPSLADWIGDFVEEWAKMPRVKNDDQVDTGTQAITYLTQNTSGKFSESMVDNSSRVNDVIGDGDKW